MVGCCAFRPRRNIGGMLKSQSERIALVRTIAPLAWSLVLTTLANWGFELDRVIADAVNLDVEFTNRAMTVVIGVALWLLARFAPNLFERLLLWVRVDDYAYTKPDGSLVVPSGEVEHAAPVIRIDENALGRSDEWVSTYLARQPSAVALRAAAASLLEAADEAA